MLILVIALTKAASQAPLLSAKVVKGTMVRGCWATLLSEGRVNGALPLLVSEKYLLSQVPTVLSSSWGELGAVTRCLAVVWAPSRAARSTGENPLDAGTY